MRSRFDLELANARHRMMQRLAGRPPARRAPEKESRKHQITGSSSSLEAMSAAVRAWRATPEGESALAAALRGDTEALRLALDTLVSGSAFAALRASRAVGLSIDGLPFTPSSVSVGFCGMIDFGVGVYGCIGYAADLDDIYSTSSVAIYAAGTLGIDEGVDAGVQLGLWKDPVADMEGWYWGVGLEIGFVGDMAVVGLAHDDDDDDLAAVLVNVDGGENDGAEGLFFGALTFALTRYPMAQTPASHMLILQSLTCVEQAATSGHDEVYFLFQPDSGTIFRYPEWNYYAMTDDTSKPEHTWATGRSVWFDGQVSVNVYDGGNLLSSMMFYLDDFASGSVTKTPPATGGLNKVQYSMKAILVK